MSDELLEDTSTYQRWLLHPEELTITIVKHPLFDETPTKNKIPIPSNNNNFWDENTRETL